MEILKIDEDRKAIDDAIDNVSRIENGCIYLEKLSIQIPINMKEVEEQRKACVFLQNLYCNPPPSQMQINPIYTDCHWRNANNGMQVLIYLHQRNQTLVFSILPILQQ